MCKVKKETDIATLINPYITKNVKHIAKKYQIV